MKPSHYYASMAVSGACLLLSLSLIVRGCSNNSVQQEIQKQQTQLQGQQETINSGQAISQQIGPNLLRDMAEAAVTDPPMKALLAKHGYSVNVAATPAPGASPAPGATPAAGASPAPAGSPAPAAKPSATPSQP